VVHTCARAHVYTLWCVSTGGAAALQCNKGVRDGVLYKISLPNQSHLKCSTAFSQHSPQPITVNTLPGYTLHVHLSLMEEYSQLLQEVLWRKEITVMCTLAVVFSSSFHQQLDNKSG